MKLTTHLALALVVLFGTLATLYALFGVNVLALITAYNPYACRALLSLAGIAAGWLLFYFLAFNPTRYVR